MDSEPERDLELTPRGGMIRLEEDGILYGPRGGRRSFTRYSDVTHFGCSERGFSLGTRQRAVVLRRGRFRDEDGPERLEQALARRIAAQPGGLAQLARIAEVEKLARNPARRWATHGVIAVCIVIAWLQTSDHFVTTVGALVPDLVRHGEYWRVVTANFLHEVSILPVHLTMNMLGILVLAMLVERPLGAMRTLVIVAASCFGAMIASVFANYQSVIGASGIASGLAGAALCLELRFPDRLPVWWRLPRRLFLMLVLVDGTIGFALPAIAGWAHLGGFVSGYLATRLLAGTGLAGTPVPRFVKALVAVFGVVFVLSGAAAGLLVSRNSAALERHARDLLAVEDAGPLLMNEVAWVMATESDATAQQLEPAVELAERAVDATDRSNPDLLDTLAEVLFQIGDVDAALDVIDEAISIARGEPYFREQRKRFTGERAADDRPDPPDRSWPLREREQPTIPKNPEIEV